MEQLTVPVSSMALALMMITLVVVVLISSVAWRRYRRSQRKNMKKKALNLPPGPRGWPVIGSLGLLADPLPPHRVLARLAARYGPLMHLRLGSFHVVVASSEETARLLLKTHDHAFADRPPTAFGSILGYGYRGIVQTPYGPYWRMARRLCATELFSASRVDAFEPARAQETRALTRALYERAGAVVAVKEHLLRFTMRNIVRMALGQKRSSASGSDNNNNGRRGSSCSESDDEAFRRALQESFKVTGLLGNVGEWVPWLGWLDVQGCVRRMRRVHVLFDQFNEQILSEHQQDRASSGVTGTTDDADMNLVDVLLRKAAEDGQQEETATAEKATRLTRDGVKAFLLDIIGGGTETAATTMEWAIVELLRHPRAMDAATEELGRVVGPDRWPTERDLPCLPYAEAVVKETMRLHPVGPLLIPHHAREHAVVDGYDVPRGTRLLVNMWAVGRDPASWPDEPGAFRPERFLPGGSGEGVDVRGAHFRLLPFGSGRRMCPAYSMAMKEMVAAVANLVHGFTWRLPNDGAAPEDLSMEESFGLNVCRKEPLLAVVEPRLPPHLYDAVD